MDRFLNDQLTEKYGFELSDSSTQQITDILHSEDIPAMDFRQQIEVKFNRSKANLNYVFPRKRHIESDSESLMSLEDKGLCDLTVQPSN